MIIAKNRLKSGLIVGLGISMALVACGTDTDNAASVSATEAAAETDAETGDTTTDSSEDSEDSESSSSDSTTSFQIEVWADNWMAVYVDGELVGEDSVPITTERSFNAEIFTFEAAYPFTVAIEAKDFKETDSGIEYIGESNQQMGDGGIIAQITDTATGAVVASTDASWSSLVIHRAPLNTECVSDADPDATCEYEIIDAPSDWTAADFDDSAWSTATEWSASDVDPKIGYDEISWDDSAQLIWGTDLEIDNTILLRTNVTS